MSTKQKTAIVTSASQGHRRGELRTCSSTVATTWWELLVISAVKRNRGCPQPFCAHAPAESRPGLAASLALGALSAHAAPTPFPADFRSSQVVNADATINVRVGGHGPAVVLIHGFGETGDMWSPMTAELAKDHTVVVPDLRGMGLSSHPAGGYDKWTQAGDIAPSSTSSHRPRRHRGPRHRRDGTAYAYAARYPDKTSPSGRD